MSKPSKTTPSGTFAADAFASVGNTSRAVKNSSETIPAGIRPGQRIRKGTRTPPSNMSPLRPLSGPESPAPPAPLSETKITIVWSLSAYSSKRSSTRPTELSIQVTEAMNLCRRSSSIPFGAGVLIETRSRRLDESPDATVQARCTVRRVVSEIHEKRLAPVGVNEAQRLSLEQIGSVSAFVVGSRSVASIHRRHAVPFVRPVVDACIHEAVEIHEAALHGKVAGARIPDPTCRTPLWHSPRRTGSGTAAPRGCPSRECAPG